MSIGERINSLKEKNYLELFKDVIVFGIGVAFAKAIQFLLMPLYTTYLSTDAYARGELVNSISDLLLPIATLCLYESGFRYIAESFYKKEEIYSTVIRIVNYSLITGFVFFSLIRFCLHWNYSFLLFLDLYGYSYMWVLSYMMKGKGGSKAFVTSGIINALFLLILSYLLIAILKMNEQGYLLAIGLSYIPACAYLLLKDKTYKLINSRFYSDECKNTLLRYGLPLVIYNLGYWLVTVSGRYVLLFLSSESDVGIYVASMKISGVMNMVFTAVHASFQLNGIRQYTQERKEEYYSKVSNLFVCVFCVMASVLILLTPIISKILLKKEFNAGEKYMPCIILSATIYSFSSLYGTMYSIYKKPNRLVPCIFIGAIVNIVISMSLVPVINIWGVIIGGIFSYLFQFLYKIIDQKQFVNIYIKWGSVIINGVMLLLSIYLRLHNYSGVFVFMVTLVTIIVNAFFVFRFT